MAQFREWLSTIITRTGGVVGPMIKIFLEDYGISHSARSIYELLRRLCFSTKSTNPKPLLEPSSIRDRSSRLVNILPAVARYLKLNFNPKLKNRLQDTEDIA